MEITNALLFGGHTFYAANNGHTKDVSLRREPIAPEGLEVRVPEAQGSQSKQDFSEAFDAISTTAKDGSCTHVDTTSRRRFYRP